MGVSPSKAETEEGLTEVMLNAEIGNCTEFETREAAPATGKTTATDAVPAAAIRELSILTVN
jgi:hypothetical protein